jgi:hypothetical protein
MSNRLFKQKVLDPGPRVNPFIAMSEAGMTPTQIKAFIVEVLKPYFSDSNRLEELAIDVLSPQAVNLVRLENDAWAATAFRHVWNLYRRASEINPDATYRSVADSESAISVSLAEYWSALYLEEPKLELGLHDFKYEVFRNIGALVEAHIQPLLRSTLAQARIIRGKTPQFADVQRLKLGKVVDELFQTAGLPDLFAPPPWGIRLNQWRNTAQHHRSRVQGVQILGVIGEPPNESEIAFSREELLATLHRLYSVYQVLSLARTLFFFDRLDQIRSYLPETEVRSDVRMMSFVAGVSTQGFQVVDLSVDASAAKVTLHDLRQTTEERIVHASQLLIPLWRSSRSQSVEVRYLTSAGAHKMTFRTLGDACRRLDSEECSVKEYLDMVAFVPAPHGSPGSTST